MDLFQKMREDRYVPKQNVDEDFPPFAGEYRASLKTLRPWVDEKGSGEKEAYMLEWRITESLSGDKADGRVLSKFYRMAGQKFDSGVKVPVTDADAVDAIKSLCNDLYTAGVELDRSAGTAEFEASFAKAIGATAYIRAWHFVPKAEQSKPESEQRRVQQYIVKTERDLRKGSKDGASRERIPF